MTLFLLYISVFETEIFHLSYSIFTQLLSTQPAQTLGDYFLLHSLPLSLSHSVSPYTHHIYVDSPLACGVWTVTALGSNGCFPKMCPIRCSLFVLFQRELWVECEFLHHCRLTQQQECQAAWRQSVYDTLEDRRCYTCVDVVVDEMTLVKVQCKCLGLMSLLQAGSQTPTSLAAEKNLQTTEGFWCWRPAPNFNIVYLLIHRSVNFW